MFPRGWPGVALLLLRASAVTALLLQHNDHDQQLSVWMQGFTVVLAALLAAGFQTPIAVVAALLFHGTIWVHLGIGSVGEATIITLDLMALALLGPGAYSVDSYRFGRRVLVLPPP